MSDPLIRHPRVAGIALLSALALSTSLAFTSAHAQTMLINVDFNAGQFGRAAGPNQTGAAVIGSAGDVWNGFGSSSAPATGTNLPLLASNNTSTAATLSYAVSGGYNTGGNYANNQGNNFAPTPYVNLMQDFFANYSTTTASTVTIGGLTANTPFTLYVYSEGNTNTGSAIFSTSGSTGSLTLAADPNQGSFIASPSAGSNYGMFSGTVPATGSVTISWLEGGTQEADFNGFQLQAVPEPSTVWTSMVGAALLAFVVGKRSSRLV